MYNPLLFEYGITIPRIMKQVASVTNTTIEFMQLPDGQPQARKREYVNARQISMRLAKKYTKDSLSVIGMQHGGRDHATVLHACKTIDNLIDTKDPIVYQDYTRLDGIVMKWKSDYESMKKEALEKSPQEDTIQNTEK